MISPSCTTYSLPSMAILPGLAARFFRTETHVIVVFDHLGADKATFEIGVNDPGGLRRLRSFRIRPARVSSGPVVEYRFRGIQPTVRRPDQPVDARFFQSDLLEKHLSLLVSIQFGDIGLGSGRYDQQFGILFADRAAYRLYMSIPAHRAFFVHVADIEHRLIGQQIQIVDQLAVFLVQFDGAGAFALLQRQLVTRQDVEQPFGALIPGRSLLCTLAMRLSTVSRSFSCSSASMISLSRTGSTLPSTCVMLSSSKQRST